MASTYTPGGIELMADGEKSNTWGQITNENWELMEEMVAGVVSIPLTGLTTYTLTTSDGVTSNGRHAVIKFTGTTSGTVTVTVSPNDFQKVYFIDNAVDQDVTLTQGSGANVTVPAGFKKIVYCDGAGAGAAVTDITGSLDITTLSLGGTEVTATAAELNILDGVTADKDEINILDGVTASTAELNILDGVTAATAEINLLDGVTLTTAEINGAATATGTSYDGSNVALTSTDVQDALDELCTLPNQAKTANYTLQATDVGGMISITTGTITVPASVFSVGDTVIIYNNASTSRTIARASGVTMYWVNGANANRTLLQRGLATLVCVGTNTFVITGQGLS